MVGTVLPYARCRAPAARIAPVQPLSLLGTDGSGAVVGASNRLTTMGRFTSWPCPSATTLLPSKLLTRLLDATS